MWLIPGDTKVKIEIFKGIGLIDSLVGLIGLSIAVLLFLSNLPLRLPVALGIIVITVFLVLSIDDQPNYIFFLNIIKYLVFTHKYDMRLAPVGAAAERGRKGGKKKKGKNKGRSVNKKGAKRKKKAAEAIPEIEAQSKNGTEVPADNGLKEAVSDSLSSEETAIGNGQQSEENEALMSLPGLTKPVEANAEAEAETEEKAQVPLTKKELKARQKAEKAEWKADSKLLRSKQLTKEEEDAIWLKRAKQSAEKKKNKKIAKSASAKVESMVKLRPYTDIKDNLISYAGRYYGAVLEIPPVDFRFFGELRRNNTIVNGFGKMLRTLNPDYAFNIVKIERKVDYTEYRKKELERIEDMKRSFENGMIEEGELQRRIDIIYGRVGDIDQMMSGAPTIVPFYYLVFFDADRTLLENNMRNAVDILNKGEMSPKRLNDEELAVFLKYSNDLDFDEKEVKNLNREDYVRWGAPDKLEFRRNTVVVNGLITQNMYVTKYPGQADDAWLASVMSLPSTKVVVKCTPMDRDKSVRAIDRSLMELRGSLYSSMMDSRRLEIQSHIGSLEELLRTLQGETELLLSTNIYVTSYDVVGTEHDAVLSETLHSDRRRSTNMRKFVKHSYREHGIRLNSMNFEQMNTYIGSQVSGYDPFAKRGRGIPSNTIAASYPWIYSNIADEGGLRMGSSEGVPVFLNMFQRDSMRVNSNAVIVGKSGSGKSFATKTILSNLATEDARIYILDPENEYAELSANLGGKLINVGNASSGRLNPFQIMTTLEDEGDSEVASDSFSMHLQFLEEFFQQIMPDCDKDALEYLNTIVERMYAEKGIDRDCDISKLKPSDYPIFDDLYDSVLREFQRTENEFLRSMLRTLMNYVSKFAADGRNANIWNGPSSITTEENFCVFNFQSLLANRNGSIANAQMLLVLKYLDNEIIKNREYNLKYHANRKIIVVIDEAHVFIDTKFPIALDFMFQLAKRIRKYNGMQIVITQNIKDFVGSEDIARKSTAIINACQYSFIFSLAPNDMADLCTLYEKSGGINEREQEQIMNAQRGEAFMILGPTSRSSFFVEAPANVRTMFEEMSYESPYFTEESGEEAWNTLLGDSRETRSMNMIDRMMEQEEESQEEEIGFVDTGSFHFEEIEESDWEEMEKERKEKEAKEAEAARWEEAREADRMAREENFMKQTIRKENAANGDLPAYAPEPVAAAAQVPNPVTMPIQPVAVSAEQSAQIPQVPIQIVVPEQAIASAANVAAAGSSSRVEQMLTEMLGTFSHDSMQSEINRRVEEEVQKRLDDVMDSLKQSAAFATATGQDEEVSDDELIRFTDEDLGESDDMEDNQPDDLWGEENSEDEDEGTDDLLASLFGNSYDEEEETEESSDESYEEDSEDEDDFLQNLFGFADDSDDEDGDFGSDSGSDSDSDDDSDFDLGSLLGDMFEEMDEVSAIEQMNLYGDTVIDINIDELTKYVKNLRKSGEH